jgi:type I restriction enzyme R subunit
VTPTDLAELDRLLFESGGVGSRQEFERAFGKAEHLGDFVRRLVGLDREAAKQAFAEFLQGGAYTASQIGFVNQVIDHLTRNGVMDPSLLYEPPYTDFSSGGVEALFPETADELFGILVAISANAGAGTPACTSASGPSPCEMRTI